MENPILKKTNSAQSLDTIPSSSHHQNTNESKREEEANVSNNQTLFESNDSDLLSKIEDLNLNINCSFTENQSSTSDTICVDEELDKFKR